MLRVLTLSTLYPDASRPDFGVFVERQTQGLAAHADVELRVVAPIGLPPWPLRRHPRYRGLAALPERESWRGVEVLRPRFLAMPGTKGRFHARMLARSLGPVLAGLRREFPFDVIDASFFFPDGPAAVALGRRFGVPVSIKARGADIHFWGMQPATSAQVLGAGQDADGLLAVSIATQADMVKLGIPGKKVRVHYTGVDQDRFAPRDKAVAKASWNVAGPLVVSTGALIPRKGHDILIRAIADLPGVTLLIAGEGAERDALERLIAGLGLGDRVRLLGGVPHDALPDLLAAADVFALASASEGLANAWVEAVASGVPIVITDAGGAFELITRPVAGRVVAREPFAFVGAISALLAEPPAPAKVRGFAAPFTWEANTAALYDHLNGMVQARG